MLYCHNKLKGFTLSEMIIVMIVLSFVAMATVPMLGNKKIMNPKKTTSSHGVFECYYEGNTLYQFTANNTDNKLGTKKAVKNYCTFEPPGNANFFSLYMVGGGGNGPSQKPSYKNKPWDESGSVSTGEGFAADIEKAPDWVKEYWNGQWSRNPEVIPRYYISSPVGYGGRSACYPIMNSQDPLCKDCIIDNKNLCADSCYTIKSAKGGDSGKGAYIIVQKRLMKEHVVNFVTSKMESALSFGDSGNRISPAPSGNGGAAKADYATKALSEGEKGRDAKDINEENVKNLGDTVVEFDSNNIISKAGSGCIGDNGQPGESAKYGDVSTHGPDQITYRWQSPGILAKIGYAGAPGVARNEIFEKLPVSGLKLYPGKQGQQTRVLRVEDNQPFVEPVAGGADSSSLVNEHIPISGGFYPFPEPYLSAMYSQVPVVQLASSAGGFKSALGELRKKYDYIPGQSGFGAYPVITNVSGKATFTLNGIKVKEEELTPIEYNEDTTHCKNGICLGSSGSAGAVVISW